MTAAAAYEAEVYSNEQWKVYRVPGTVAQLTGFARRWTERDAERGEHGVYHVFELIGRDEDGNETAADLADPEVEAFYRLVCPRIFDTCPHGMSADGCYDPVSHWA